LYESQSFILSVEVTGSGPITYQWRRNGNPVGTERTYEIWAASYSMDNYLGTYDVVVTSPSGSVTSQAVEVVRSGPTVTVTKSGGAGVGSTLILTANATGKGPFTSTWGRAGGQTFDGATGATLVLPNVISTDTSAYNVSVADADGLSGMGFATVQGPEANPLPTQYQVATEAGQRLTLRAPVSSTDLGQATYPVALWRRRHRRRHELELHHAGDFRSDDRRLLVVVPPTAP
jgi:hypothetical protein